MSELKWDRLRDIVAFGSARLALNFFEKKSEGGKVLALGAYASLF